MSKYPPLKNFIAASFHSNLHSLYYTREFSYALYCNNPEMHWRQGFFPISWKHTEEMHIVCTKQMKVVGHPGGPPLMHTRRLEHFSTGSFVGPILIRSASSWRGGSKSQNLYPSHRYQSSLTTSLKFSLPDICKLTNEFGPSMHEFLLGTGVNQKRLL